MDFGRWTVSREYDPARSVTRFILLYLRSRQVAHAVAVLVGVELTSWAVARWLISRPKFEPAHLDLVIGFAALAAACVVGAGIRSPFGENENLSARHLEPFRLGHLAGLLIIAVFLLVLISSGWEREGVAWLLVRNLLGLSGMAFLCAYMVDGSLSWMLPVGFSLSLRFVGQDQEGKWLWWAWTEQTARDALSWSVALGLLAAGVCAVCLLKACQGPGREID